VIVTPNASPAVGVKVAGATEKRPGEVPPVGVLTGVDVVVVAVPSGVVRSPVVVVAGGIVVELAVSVVGVVPRHVEVDAARPWPPPNAAV
jgi:hypothetical protein